MNNLKQLIEKNTIYYLVILILILGYGFVTFIIPQVSVINEKKGQIDKIQAEVSSLEQQQQAQQAQKNMEAQRNKSTNLPLSIYKSPFVGMDIENASVGMVDEILKMMKKTNNKIEEISFTTKPQDPSIPAEIGILTLSLNLNTTYSSLKEFLEQVYLWNYLSAIKDLTISQDKTNPEIITATLNIDLYINKT